MTFTDRNAGRVWRLVPACLLAGLVVIAVAAAAPVGTVSKYATPASAGRQIVAGPDGALWFANYVSHSVGRITTGGAVSSYTDPSVDFPYGIASGPDGALWFANNSNNSIGRITTGGVIGDYTDPSIRGPVGIAAGPDGALWTANGGNSSIGADYHGRHCHRTTPIPASTDRS